MQIAAFTGIVLLGAMNPGLDFTIVVRQSALLGRRGGMATALGIGAGVFLCCLL
ncbi:lysine transporter LysE, partial [Spongiactinospora gelatinilytica]